VLADAPRTDDRPAIVEVRGACKTYDTGTRALAHVDLDVRRGEFLTLVGPSGCGKSTLLSLIAGLTAPTTGRVQWWGGDFANTGGAGRKIAFVFQSPTLMPWARVTTRTSA
jgi:NitT/TauT family transport system ATP-binding protein